MSFNFKLIKRISINLLAVNIYIYMCIDSYRQTVVSLNDIVCLNCRFVSQNHKQNAEKSSYSKTLVSNTDLAKFAAKTVKILIEN